MELSFVKLLNTSISAGWLILVVMVLRLVLKKAPKSIHCLLWAMVAVRLMCPVSIESVFSLIPSAETVPEIYLTLEGEARQYGAVLTVVGNSLYPASVQIPVGGSIDRVQMQDLFWTVIWLVGLGVMALYALVSYLRIRARVRASVVLEENIRLCDYIDTPFILGLISPRIYLPSAISPEDRSHVLAHERAHIQRRDHWWKPLGFVLLSIYWFNPLIWLAYILLCRDIEMACDERVIRDLDVDGKKAYSRALLGCSVRGPLIAACPLAFGEVGVKERVKTVLNYKKPAFWMVAIALAVCAVVAVCFLTDPKVEETTPEVQTDPVPISELDENDRSEGNGVFLGGQNYNMWLDIPAGWQYELCDDYDNMGIAFRPETVEEGWVKLVFMPQGIAMCGTGLEISKIGELTTYGYDGQEWNLACFTGLPGCYAVTRENADAWWPEYKDQALQILSTARLAQGMKTQAEIQQIAAVALADVAQLAQKESIGTKIAVILGEPTYMAHFHGDTGLWEVGLYFLADSSPRAVVWIDTQGNVVEHEDWHINLFADDVSPTGLTLVCEQYGVIPGDGIAGLMDLMTGAPFWLEVWNGSGWEMVPAIPEETVWTTEGWRINRNDTTRWNVGWEYLYGELESGTYRIGKNVSKGNRPGEYAHQNFYAVFQILDVDPDTAVAEEQESTQGNGKD